ncbi:MAG TPA: NAD+ synthase [Actinopolymorphaceae bacterium]|jgi:NAD+ synthase (glutamine-hydrolysing)
MPALRLALAQTNMVVGDIAGNCAKIVTFAREASRGGADLLAFPEMAVTGYPVEDLALRGTFVAASRKALDALAGTLRDEGLGELVVVIGYLDATDGIVAQLGVPKGSPRNALAVLHRGEVRARSFKHHLPNYGVFDEFRHFVPGNRMAVVTVNGVDVAVCICEDLWQDGPSAAARAADAGLLLVINGSPFEANKDDTRLELCARRAREAGCALAYVNLVGGQDELVFDGDSLVVGPDGELVARAAQFVEELLVLDLDLPAASEPMPDTDESFEGLAVAHTHITSLTAPVPDRLAFAAPTIAPRYDDIGEVYTALVVGLRDYIVKNGMKRVFLGVSGGIDSTLVAAIACDAIGAANVFGISNPSVYSSQHSRDDAAELARRTGMNLQTVAIAPMVDAFGSGIEIDGVAAENLQARVRAVIWMALSNYHEPSIVLACGNKSELAVGYSTIYGDAVGGFAPIKDVLKTQVWELARWRNAQATANGETPPIPENTITKEPSAELRPGQKDSDSLPDYHLLDDILDDYIERDAGSDELVAAGFDRDVVEQVLRLVDRAEYKRRQYPPGTKISSRNFGRDRRLPITSKWRE